MRTGHTSLEDRRPDHRISLRLFGFVLASVTLHAAVLLSQQTAEVSNEPALRTMQVTLGSIKTVEAQVEPAQKKPAPPTPKQPKKIAVAPKAVEVPAVAPESKVPVTPPQPATTATTSAISTKSNELAAQARQQRITLTQLLRQALSKHFYYPMLARKRGWEGEVRLAFTLDTSGTIINARITQHSGYSTLDRAALKSLSQVAALEQRPSSALTFELPVIYSFSGG